MSVKDRVVVVTGGNGGIGLGLSRGIIRHGGKVAIWGRNEVKNHHAVTELTELGGEALAISCDISDPASVEAALDSTLQSFGRIHGLIANAGVSAQRQSFLDSTPEEWSRVLDTNLLGTVATLRTSARAMVEAGEGGALVVVSSVSAIDGAPGVLPYAATKSALLGVVRGLAVELARYRIRVNALLPGWIETDMTLPLQGNQRFMEVTLQRTPVRRWGSPTDFEEIGAYLADPDLVFHTGDSIVVDGGYSIF
jgi:NAD(P)-dependent dehydrogenase (short-subunit alcohol dehydrogenase family)